MPVRNQRKAARQSEKGGSTDFPTRPLFICDPAVVCPAIRGDRPRSHRTGYKERVQERSKQATPAYPSIAAHKGPSHREGEITFKEWDLRMTTGIRFGR